MFIKKGENADKKMLEQGIDQAKFELRHVDEDETDRARTRRRIADMERRLRAL
jgi:hypothetical protein